MRREQNVLFNVISLNQLLKFMDMKYNYGETDFFEIQELSKLKRGTHTKEALKRNATDTFMTTKEINFLLQSYLMEEYVDSKWSKLKKNQQYLP